MFVHIIYGFTFMTLPLNKFELRTTFTLVLNVFDFKMFESVVEVNFLSVFYLEMY